MKLKSDAKLEEKLTCGLEMTWGIWKILTIALENLKVGTLMGSFFSKLKMYELKIYRRVMCHGNKKWYKNWRGIELSLQNWLEEFDDFWPKHLKEFSKNQKSQKFSF